MFALNRATRHNSGALEAVSHATFLVELQMEQHAITDSSTEGESAWKKRHEGRIAFHAREPPWLEVELWGNIYIYTPSRRHGWN